MNKILEKSNSIIEQMSVVKKILEKYSFDKTKLIPILQAVQEEFKYLPKDIISYVATSLNLPPANVYGVATFYAHFSLEAKGKYILRLCDGTACHVKKSTSILEALYGKLNLSSDKQTSDDMMFTVETVSCLGACGLAPVMLVNDEVYGQVKPEQAVLIVDEIIKTEKQ